VLLSLLLSLLLLLLVVDGFVVVVVVFWCCRSNSSCSCSSNSRICCCCCILVLVVVVVVVVVVVSIVGLVVASLYLSSSLVLSVLLVLLLRPCTCRCWCCRRRLLSLSVLLVLLLCPCTCRRRHHRRHRCCGHRCRCQYCWSCCVLFQNNTNQQTRNKKSQKFVLKQSTTTIRYLVAERLQILLRQVFASGQLGYPIVQGVCYGFGSRSHL